MPWKVSSPVEERMKSVVRLLEGEEMGVSIIDYLFLKLLKNILTIA